MKPVKPEKIEDFPSLQRLEIVSGGWADAAGFSGQ